MKVSQIMIGIGFLGLMTLPGAFAQEAAVKVHEPIIRTTFEEGLGTWTTFGNGAAVSITHEPLEVKEGKGALKFKYEVNMGDLEYSCFPLRRVVSKRRTPSNFG